jgi:hypothetical protein
MRQQANFRARERGKTGREIMSDYSVDAEHPLPAPNHVVEHMKAIGHPLAGLASHCSEEVASQLQSLWAFENHAHLAHLADSILKYKPACLSVCTF